VYVPFFADPFGIEDGSGIADSLRTVPGHSLSVEESVVNLQATSNRPTVPSSP
jgi:hypothetical protein